LTQTTHSGTHPHTLAIHALHHALTHTGYPFTTPCTHSNTLRHTLNTHTHTHTQEEEEWVLHY